MYSNYRFYLSDVHTLNPERIEGILNESKKDLGLERIAAILPEDRTISLLCHEETGDVKNKVIQLLSKNGIILAAEKTQIEPLEDVKKVHSCGHKHDAAESCTHDHHGHDHHGHNHHRHNHHGHGGHKHKTILGILWGIGLLILGIASFNLPLIAYIAITGLTAAVTLYLGFDAYKAAWNALRGKKIEASVLYAISTLTILIVSVASLFIPGLPMIFEAAPLVLGFWHLSHWIEHKILDKVHKNTDLRDCISEQVTLKGQSEKIAAAKIIYNDVLVIHPNEVIPADGELLGEATLSTERINGQKGGRFVQQGTTVKQGMRLLSDAPVTMRVKTIYQQSYLSNITHDIEQADKNEENKAKSQVLADKILRYFVPALLGVALVSGLVVGIVFTPIIAIQCVITVLISACPCVFATITPAALHIGRSKIAERGVTINKARAFETAGKIKTVVFDLNGTLTEGNPKVHGMTVDEEFLPYVSALEKKSQHSFATAIHTHIRKMGKDSDSLEPLEVKRYSMGITGTFNGLKISIGNSAMLDRLGVKNNPYDPKQGTTYIVLEKSDSEPIVIGQIDVADELRKDAIATVQQLKAQGKTIHLCTGADELTAKKFAQLLKIPQENIYANAVGDKQNYIKKLQKNGTIKVAMVGDAANDISALRQANFSIAIASDNESTQHAQQNAHMVVDKEGTLFPIANTFHIAKKTNRNIKQNFIMSLTYNSVITLVAAGLFVALGFTLNPAIGVALLIVESVLVLANLYRLKKQKNLIPPKDMDIPDEKEFKSSTATTLKALDYQAQTELSHEHLAASSFIPKPLFSESKKQNDACSEPPNEGLLLKA